MPIDELTAQSSGIALWMHQSETLSQQVDGSETAAQGLMDREDEIRSSLSTIHFGWTDRQPQHSEKNA